jgi:chromosomal replication initiation ATPase DnaA
MHDEQAYQQAWRRVLERIRPEIGIKDFRAWLQPLELQQVRDLHVILIAPTRALHYWASTHYSDRLLVLWQAENQRVDKVTIAEDVRVDDADFGDQIADDPKIDPDPDHQNTWRRVLDRVRRESGDDAVDWLRDLKLQRVELLEHDVTVTVVAPTTFLRDWVSVHYADRLFALLQMEEQRVGRLTLVSPPLVLRSQPDELAGDAEPAGSVGPPLPTPVQKNRGGRAPKFEWESLWFELIRIAQIDGFNSRRELRQRALAWISANWSEEPSDSVLREKLSRLGDTLGLPVN